MPYTVHLRNLIVLGVVSFFIHYIVADPPNRRILPTEVEVREGEDLQVHLLQALDDEATCYARTPLHVNCNLKLADSEKNASCDERVHYWPVNDACGFYITNVQKEDNGVWRLMSQSDDKKVVDIVIVTVLDKFDGKLEEDVEITKGMTYMLTFPDVENYCIVQNPHDPSSIILHDVCNVEIETVSATDGGTWNAVVGVRGQIEEVVKTINVSVFYEHVNSGYTISSNPEAIHIYCNYIAMDNRLTMCRFALSSANQKGLRLREGMRKGRYEYYGNGLNAGECGLTIQSPQEKDYGIWHCLLHVMDKPSIATVVEVLKPASFQQTYMTRAVTLTRTSAVSPVITTEGEVLKLECSSNKPLSYCWFSQPNGEIYQAKGKSNTTTFSNVLQEDTYWFDNCDISIDKADWEHNGTWICHMGPASPGVESTEEINVRIAETPLAAIEKFVSPSNVRIIFRCKTVPHVRALSYCRFQSPTGFGIHINELITESNAIEQDDVRYWYSGQSLAAGDCGLVVEPASSIHNGNWTCAANIELLGTNESFDTIYFSYDKPIPNENTENNTARIISIVFGSLGFVIALGILITLGIKYQERFCNRSQSQSGNDLMQRQDDISLNTMPTDISILSGPSTSRNNGNNDSRNSGGSDGGTGTDNSNNTDSSSNNSPRHTHTLL